MAFYHYQKLHRSQTVLAIRVITPLFYHYQKLHRSQTTRFRVLPLYSFYHYQKLHRSQTSNCIIMQPGHPQAVPPSQGQRNFRQGFFIKKSGTGPDR